ncbi:hypothetical protein [Roseomonas sp. KE0001]|uniref:hypothetical protein n=1 Tax=Roseomonas sp. KE0001 TaxID=2479201 RepID=UPI0038D25A32
MLLPAKGLSNLAIVERLGVARMTVVLWRRRPASNPAVYTVPPATQKGSASAARPLRPESSQPTFHLSRK